MRLPGSLPPWGRWERGEDGRVMLSFRCVCCPGEVHTQWLTAESGASVEMRCPRCRLQLVQVRASRDIPADGGAPGTGRK